MRLNVSAFRYDETVAPASLSVTVDPALAGCASEEGFMRLDPLFKNQMQGYTVIDVLSETGMQANVYRVSCSGQESVLKVYRRHFIPDEDAGRRLEALDCATLAKRMDSGKHVEGAGTFFYEVFPFYGSSTLRDLVERGGGGIDYVENVLLPALVDALESLHGVGVIHGDIKPDNIFLDEQGKHPVLGDFGIASLRREAHDLVPFRGTREFSLARLVDGQVVLNEASDWGAVGLVLYYALTGRSALKAATLEERAEALEGLAAPDHISSRFRNLIQGFLERDERLRFGLREARAFLNESRSANVHQKKPGVGFRSNRAMNQERRRPFEFGFIGKNMLVARDLAELLERCQGYWSHAAYILDSRALRLFLRHQTGDDAFAQEYLDEVEQEADDFRIYALTFGLKKAIDGTVEGRFVYRDVAFGGILDVLDRLIAEGLPEALDFVESGLFLWHVVHAGYGDVVVSECKAILGESRKPSEKARRLAIIIGLDDQSLPVGSVLVDSVEGLLRALMECSWEEVEAVASDPKLGPWLFARGCDPIGRELEALDEQ